MIERGFDVRREGLGILLFAFGAFFAVLLLKAFASDVPASEAGGTAALAALWIDSIGGLAGLVFTGGLALLGARMFMDGQRENTLRHTGGLALVAMGLSILVGSVSQSGGGALGSAIGGGISGVTHVAIGALVGIGVLASAIWVVWLRGAGVPHDDVARDDLAAADGVTPAEAAALIPNESHRALEESRKSERASTWTAPPSPYPEDVRRRGEIPAGAKPLEPTHAHPTPQSGAPASSVYRWTADRTEEPAHGARSDLARTAEPAPMLAHAFEVDEYEELVEELPEPLAQALIDDRIDEPIAQALIDDELDDEFAVAEAASLDPAAAEQPMSRVEPLAAVPRPSWEQSSLFEEGEEPVDAYGTPLSLVGSIVERPREAELDDVDVAEPVGALDDEDEEDFEDDEDEADDDEDDDDAEDDDADEDEEEEEDEEDEEEAEAEDDVYAEEHGEEAQETVVVAIEVVRAERMPAAPEASREPRLKDVVLTPQVAMPQRAEKPLAVPADRQKLLVEAGCLFLDRGRVAVSMLQRQYAMDFDEACKVLDELQEMGLIGPYMGGQRRDILLTRDQWLERVTSS